MDTKKKAALALALSGMMGSAVWSPASYACPAEPLMTSVCIMAATAGYLGKTFNGGGGDYALADGRQLNISQYTAFYALVGVTYGGDSVKVFNIPDLRGRVVVGSGILNGTSTGFALGQQGGSTSVTLTSEQMPNHFHSLLNAPVTLGLTATTTLEGLTATANLGGVVVSGAASGLTLKAASNASTNDPNGASLASPQLANPFKVYSSGAPSIALNPQSISGNLSLTIANGTTAPVIVSATPTTKVGGAAVVNANTTVVGGTSAGVPKPVPTMMPYTVLNYYVALTGIFPARGN